MNGPHDAAPTGQTVSSITYLKKRYGILFIFVLISVEYSYSNELSLVAELKINDITVNHTGNYSCYGVKNNGSKVLDVIEINVLGMHNSVCYKSSYEICM